ncbi:MAG: tRNA (adenosine(37)-N6)-threonylcarbamoyltransferase complex dimerization subunit type 1 TsaB [Candidatus Babeliales bacterium]
MISFIISTDYTHTTIALCKEKRIIAQIQEENKNTSKYMLMHMQALLKEHGSKLSDVTFIGINQGPGPFTTLRVTLATINGIAFASTIPLVGIDGIKALVEENKDTNYPYTVALLNAFNDEAYYAIQIPDTDLNIGYKKIDAFLQELKNEFSDVKFRLIGSGVNTFKEQITKILGRQALIPDSVPLAPSLEFLAQRAVSLYNAQDVHHKLLPLYLKIMNYKTSITIH